jgi:hypothetical protein
MLMKQAHIIETWDCETFKRTAQLFVMVLWIWAFCTIFLSNYFTLIVLCLGVSLCDLYSQSWQNGLPKQAFGRPQFHLSLPDLWHVLVDKQVAKFWKGMNGLFFMGCISAFLLLAKFCQKEIWLKLWNFEKKLFWEWISITKSEGGKIS